MNIWRTISDDGKTVTLNRFEGLSDPLVEDPDWIDSDELKVACVLDVETTGLDRFRDSVIEIGLRLFYFDPSNGKILGIGRYLSQLNDPKKPLDPKIAKLTGLKGKDLKDQTINWEEVSSFLNEAHLVIAHNAAFDRFFIDKVAINSGRAVWSCSMKQIGWLEHGFPTTNLQLLAAYHGFFSFGHRALIDADMIVQLLKVNPKYLVELYENAHEPRVKIKLINTEYEDRLEIRRMGYIWNPMLKTWSKSMLRKDLESEKKELESLFRKSAPQYELEDIPLSDNFRF